MYDIIKNSIFYNYINHFKNIAENKSWNILLIYTSLQALILCFFVLLHFVLSINFLILLNELLRVLKMLIKKFHFVYIHYKLDFSISNKLQFRTKIESHTNLKCLF